MKSAVLLGAICAMSAILPAMASDAGNTTGAQQPKPNETMQNNKPSGSLPVATQNSQPVGSVPIIKDVRNAGGRNSGGTSVTNTNATSTGVAK